MATLYGRSELADGGVRKPGRGGLGRTGAHGADWGTGRPADGADYTILDGAGLGQTGPVGRNGADGADWGTGGLADAATWTGRTAADGADWGGQGEVGRTGADGPVRRTGADGLVRRTGRTRRTGRRGAYWVEFGGA